MSAQRLTAICTTVARPDCARAFLRSLRGACPDLPVILGEQADVPELEALCAELGVRHIALPFDSGLSAARNALVREVTTDYFLLTEEDFRFPRAPDTALCMRFLDAHAEFVCVTGALDDLRSEPALGHDARNFAIDEAGNGLILLPLALIGGDAIGFEGAQIHPCHMGPHWGVFRTDAFARGGLHWDEDYTIGGEHIDFFLRLYTAHKDLRVGFCETLRCQHVDGDEGTYPALRLRKGWLDIFRAKWPFRYRYDLGGALRMMETYNKAEPLPSPQIDRLKDALRDARGENARLQRALDKLAS